MALDPAIEIIVIEMVGEEPFPPWVSPLQGETMKLIKAVTKILFVEG